MSAMSARASAVIVEPQERSAHLSGIAIVFALGLVRIVLYFIAANNYGYFRDELYHLACGEHPAWGYVDQPPLIGWVAWLLQHTIGTSLFALRLLPALADASTIVLAGLLAREFGGRRWAMFLAGLGILLGPIFLALSHLFTMNAFDPLLWTAIAFLLVKIAKGGSQRLWIWMGLVIGIAILNKYGVLFWLSGLLIGLVLTPLRSSLKQQWFWIGCTLAMLMALPNLFWQWRYDFPFLQLMHNVRGEGRDIVLGPLPFLAAQAQMLGYFAAILVPFALLLYFSKTGRPFRALGWAFLVMLGEMMVLYGKMYYLAPVYPMLFAAGAAEFELLTAGRVWIWAKPTLAVAVSAIGIAYGPTVLPVLSVPRFLAWEKTLGVQQQKFEHNQPGVLPQIYADMFGWEEIAARVAAFYRTLPPDVQQRTGIVANNYGDAGAIDFFGPRYGLPKAIGTHQTYWLWGPRQYTGESLIIMGEGNPRRMAELCASYAVIGRTDHPLSRKDEWLPIYYCQGMHPDLQRLWPRIKHWN
jgi:4-amino-4-deoxy-L-arabinose transferase-like glycosyltransferase